MVLYLQIAWLDPYSALLALEKYIIQDILVLNFTILFFPEKPARMVTAAWKSPYAHTNVCF